MYLVFKFIWQDSWYCLYVLFQIYLVFKCIWQDSWYSQIYEKFRNERKHAQDPLIMQRKRKLVDQGSNIKVVRKSLRRGAINWEPAYPDGEDEASMKAHVAFMKLECRKRNPDEEKICSRMIMTFPHRRRFINEKKSA